MDKSVPSKSSGVLRASLTIFGGGLMISLLALILAPALMSDNDAIRIALNAGLIVIAAYVFFSMGVNKGERAKAADALHAKNPYARARPNEFNRARTAVAAFIAALPWLILGIAVAIVAMPYSYQLQDLPSWLTPYMRQNDVGDALKYYDRVTVVSISDWLRMIQRFIMLPFVYLFAAGSDAASYALDRLSWLPPLAMPAAYFAGYLIGPARFAKTSRYIEQAKTKPRMRLKKSAVRRVRQIDPKKNRLI